MRNWTLALVAFVMLVVLGAGSLLAQEGGGGGRGRFDPEQMRQRYMDRIKEDLGLEEDAWKVIEPRLAKVVEMTTAERMSGMTSMFGRRGGGRGGRGGEGGGAPAAPETDTGKAMSALQTTLDNKEASPEEIKAKLTALRQAREKAKAELNQAQESVRELVTVRQEAQLVAMGLLE